MAFLLLAVWFFALGLIVYLAVGIVGDRLSQRREKKAATAGRPYEIQKHSRSDRPRGERSRKAQAARVSGPGVGLRRGLSIVGILVLILWELYWASVVQKTEGRSQIPLFFLFLMMIVIPATVYFFSRRIFRPSANSVSGR